MNVARDMLYVAALAMTSPMTPARAELPMGATFTYQGQLKQDGVPLIGTADFGFTLWDDAGTGDPPTGGNLVGLPVDASAVNVQKGLFKVQLDFGAEAFNGEARWLQVTMRAPAGSGNYTTLSPRQHLTSTPYALHTRGVYVGSDGHVGLGTTSAQHLLAVGGSGADSQSVNIRSYGGTGYWKGGAAFGFDSASVIMGELSGVATIAGHNASLSNWSNLALNPEGGNVGIGTALPTDRLAVQSSDANVMRLIGPGQDGDDARLYLGTTNNYYIEGDSSSWSLNIKAPFIMLDTGPDGLSCSGRISSQGEIYGWSIHSEDAALAKSLGVYFWLERDEAAIYLDEFNQGIVQGDWKFFRADNPSDPSTEIWYGCLEGPESAAYVRGTGRLLDGKVVINFPDHFRAVAKDEGMTVQLTPRSADSKGLVAVHSGLDGIVVRELAGGRGNYDFYYMVTAARRGSERFSVIRPIGKRTSPAADSESGEHVDGKPSHSHRRSETADRKKAEITALRGRIETLEGLIADLAGSERDTE